MEKVAAPSVPVAREKIAVKAAVPKEIVFTAHQQLAPTHVERKKPARISLAAPSTALTAAAEGPVRRQVITLSNTTPEVPVEQSHAPVASPVRLYDRCDCVYRILLQ